MIKMKNIMIFGGIGVVALVFCMLCAFLQNINVLYGVAFLGYQLIGVFSIGYMLKTLLGLNTKNWIESFGISYAFGYALNIICYLIAFPLFGKIGLCVCIYALVLFSLFFNWKRIDLERLIIKEDCWILIILVGVLFLQFFMFAGNNCAASYIETNSYYRDFCYWMSDVVTFTKQFPPIDFRVIDSSSYYYHYFSSIQAAVQSLVTGIPVANFGMGFYFIQSAILLVFTSYVFFSNLIKDKHLKMIAIVLFLFSTGFENRVYVTYISHMYATPFGFDVGLVFGMLAILFMIKQCDEEKLEFNLFISVILFFAICMGTKGPIGSIVLLILGCFCIRYFILGFKNKEMLKMAFFYGGILLIIFFLLYILVVNGPNTGSSKTEIFLNLGVNNTIFKNEDLLILHDMFEKHFGNFIGEIIFSIYYLILVNPAVYICAIWGGLIHVFSKEKYGYVNGIFLIAIIVSYVLFRKFKLHGFSQMYYMLLLQPIVVAFGLRGIEKYCMTTESEGNLRGEMGFPGISHNPVRFKIIINKTKTIAMGTLVLLTMIGLFYFSDSFYMQAPFTSGIRKVSYMLGMSNETDMYLANVNGEIVVLGMNEELRKSNSYLVVDKSDVEAAVWLKNHSDENSLIVSDLMDCQNYRNNYLIGIFAERFTWTEEQEVIKKAVSGDEDSIFKLKERGIRYMLIKNANVDIWKKDSIVYSNEKVAIVDLQYGD